MPDDLLTLTMTREVFPQFKRLLEAGSTIVGDYEVRAEVKEYPPGFIYISTTQRTLDCERG